MKDQQVTPEQLLGGVHPDVAHLGWLVGDWRGIGKGRDHAGNEFNFEQVVQFAHDRRPFLEYRALSWVVDTDLVRLHASHVEQGYWRGLTDNAVEVVLSNPMGIAELWQGKVEVTALENAQITGAKLLLTSTSVARTPSAPALATVDRMYGLRDGKLLMTFDMGLDNDSKESHIWLMMERV